MSIEFVTGDLFSTPDLNAFAHDCNCAGLMQRGIAITFRDRWPKMYEAYRQRCLTNQFQLGSVFAWEENGYHIFNLGTQRTWETKADISAIRSALAIMIDLASKKKICSIGLSRIGAGLGGLDWSVVKEVLIQAGEQSAVRLVVFENDVPESTTPKEIYFYRTRDAYGCFSNFSPHPFELEGRLWPTSEHYFQAAKFLDPLHQEDIRLAKSPMQAADMGRERHRPLRPDWEQVKDEVMRKAVLAKFQTHAELRAELLSTNDSLLVEKTTSDKYWGCGSDGKGRNRLGLILMEVRAQFRKS